MGEDGAETSVGLCAWRARRDSPVGGFEPHNAAVASGLADAAACVRAQRRHALVGRHRRRRPARRASGHARRIPGVRGHLFVCCPTAPVPPECGQCRLLRWERESPPGPAGCVSVAWNGLGRRRDRSAISACGILEGSVYGRVWGRVSLFVGDSDVRQTRGRNELSELVSDVSEDTDGAVGMILPHVGIGTHGRWHRDRATCDALDVEDSPDTQSPLW